MYKNWPVVKLGSGKISNDGKYMLYSIVSLGNETQTNIIKECRGEWEFRIGSDVNIEFTSDSKKAAYISNKTLYLITLGDSVIERIANVSAFRLLGFDDWISYVDSTGREITLRNLHTGTVRIYNSVNQFLFSKDGRRLVIEIRERALDSVLNSLNIIDVSSGKLNKIWSGKSSVSMVFNDFGNRLAFMVSNTIIENRSIWYYKVGTIKASLLPNDSVSGIDSSLVLENLDEISTDGQYVFFTLKRLREKASDKKRDKTTVKIWSYLDEKIPAMQFDNIDAFSSCQVAVNTVSGKVTMVRLGSEQILEKSNDGQVYLIEQVAGNGSESECNWNSSSRKNYFVRSLERDCKIQLRFNEKSLIQLSPEGKFVIYYDKKLATYYSYQLDSGVYRDITPGLNVSWINYYRDDMIVWPRGICGWVKGDKYVLIYDRFDIWRIDPSGRESPINLTNKYGLRHNVIFDRALPFSTSDIISPHDTLILNAVNLGNKQNGYFRFVVNRSANPEKLVMSNAIYHFVDNPYVDTRGGYPIKAANQSKYILLRMNATESPNYFYTEDFKSFFPQSRLSPEKGYNWYSTELINWKANGTSAMQGVLYKPENFDSTKKYPIIFYYYEKKSFSLNEYLFPRDISGDCNINIPTFVSNGYLVFTPDINYVIGDPMQGAYDAVVSAATYLSKAPFVNAERMGIGGCSFGGIETNYLVTHTSLFAAAYSASSMVDLISAYGDITRTGEGLHHAFELGQLRMGGTLWQNQDAYIRNSAIFNIDKIVTPLLIMHTTDDVVCSFSQALEFFTALRRLGKRAWLLEYSKGNHGITGEYAKDFSIRLGQFFDHYLKGEPAPLWMTNNIPSGIDGDNIGYKLDQKARTPGKGLLKE